MAYRFSHVIGFDDGPFEPEHRGDVLLVGAAYSGERLDGVLSGKVRRDGANATRTIVDMVARSRFAAQLQLVLLQGIAVAGFNVVDLWAVQKGLGIPVVAVSRRPPDLEAVKKALLAHVPGGRRKWRLVERAGPTEPAAGVHVQRAGITLQDTERLIRRLAINSSLPEPLRTSHLIAGGIVTGESRHRA